MQSRRSLTALGDASRANGKTAWCQIVDVGPWNTNDPHWMTWRVASFADVKPGDFVQLWRNDGTGHSVIFQDWERDGAGAIVGIDYWSTQSSTNGIAFNDEYFGSGGNDVDSNLVFVGRAAAPSEWIPFQ